MGFWAGVNEGLTYVLDKKAAKETEDRAYAFKREEYQQTLLAQRQELYLKMDIEKQEKEGALYKQFERARGIGLSETAAIVLQNSGQLGLIIEQYDKSDSIDPEYVKDLEVVIMNRLKDMDEGTRARALVAGFSTTRDTTDPEQARMATSEAIIAATTSEEMDRIGEELYATTPSASLQPFNLNFGAASGLDFTDVKNINNEIAKSLNEEFAGSFEFNQVGDPVATQNTTPEVTKVYALAQEFARELSSGPEAQFTPPNATAFIVGKIRAAVNEGGLGAADIAGNFSAVIENPLFKLTAAPAPDPATAPPPIPLVDVNPNASEGAIDQITDILPDEYFNQQVDLLARPK